MIFKDQLGNAVALNNIPKRIISLVPSQTELLFDLGLQNEILGITKYCVHPPEILSLKTIVGGTKKLNIEKIKELNPDLIIANKEENEKSQIELLLKDYPVWVSDIKNLKDALLMIEAIGLITGKKERAEQFKFEIQKRFIHFSINIPEDKKNKKVLYLIWRKPYIAAGEETFISHLLKLCGLKNALSGKNALVSRYPEISIEVIQNINPTHIFLSSEPYPFREKHIAELQSICPLAKVMLVDGEMFSWYGTRLLYAPSYFNKVLVNL